MEIQLTQVVGNERILNENIRTMEDRNIQLQSEVARLKDTSSRAYEELAIEAQQLQLQLNEIAGRELALQNNLKNYETDNNRLQNDLLNSQSRQNEYNRQIAILNADNNNLMQQIEATQQMRMRLRNDIIGVIDQNDNGSGSATRNRRN